MEGWERKRETQNSHCGQTYMKLPVHHWPTVMLATVCEKSEPEENLEQNLAFLNDLRGAEPKV